MPDRSASRCLAETSTLRIWPLLALFFLSAAVHAQTPLAEKPGAVLSGAELLRQSGYPPESRLLILHADDLGMSHSVDLASFKALESGWVSSASVMVPCPWFTEVAEFARKHPSADLGLHLTLTSEWKTYRWRGLTTAPGSTLLDSNGYLHHDGGPVGKLDSPAEVREELEAQVASARFAGIGFSHLDNHMGALSQSRQLFDVYLETARKAGVSSYVSPGEAVAYASSLAGHGQLPVPETIEPAPNQDLIEGWRATFSKLKPGVYITIVHLGLDDQELRSIMGEGADGARSRQKELNLVSSQAFHNLLREYGVTLVGWKDISKRKAYTKPPH